MQPITLKQYVVIYIIKLIEVIINHRFLIIITNWINSRTSRSVADTQKFKKYSDSVFQGLHVAFIADGNRRFYKKIPKQTEKLRSTEQNVVKFSEMVSDDAVIMQNQDSIENTIKRKENHQDKTSQSFNHENHIKTQNELVENQNELIQNTKKFVENTKYKMQRSFDRIIDCVDFAYKHQFKEISFFCFSTKNFQRTKEEVNDIMGFIKNHKHLNAQIPAKINIFGDLERLDKNIRDIFEKWMSRTANADGLIVNIFFAYSSSDENKHNMQFTSKVDLIVRTGDTKRLSDFMVKQAANGTAIDFVKPLWPEYSTLHLRLTLYKFLLEEKYLKN